MSRQGVRPGRRDRVAAVIPARHEAETIADVVRVARSSPWVDEVLVVVVPGDRPTAEAATRAGARLVTGPLAGKGEAMAAGVEQTGAPVILFLDGDLLGLTTHHLASLVRPVVRGDVWMAAGLFDRGPVQNWFFLHTLPNLTGERALRRELFEWLRPEELRGYKVEAALNAAAAELGVPTIAFVCPGMFHRIKEQKMETPMIGFLHKVRMIVAAVWSSISYRVRRIVGLRHGRLAQRREAA
jgi:glycosyltransferase involved in cell wall biosynthesis